MATLEKRVQVLFDPERYAQLEAAARERGLSVGAFIREAVEDRLASEQHSRLAALEELFARADADAARHDYLPFDWEEAQADWEDEMDPLCRLTRSTWKPIEPEQAETATTATQHRRPAA